MKQLNSVLLVDDDSTANFLHQELLFEMGIVREIITVLNGEEAIETLSMLCGMDKCPDLILLDINMPKMDGFEVLEKFNEVDLKGKCSTCTVVMLTSSLNPSDIKRAKEMNVKGYLTKPLNEEDVHQIMDNFVL